MARRAFPPSSYDERRVKEREKKRRMGVEIQMKVKGGVGWKGCTSVLSPAV